MVPLHIHSVHQLAAQHSAGPGGSDTASESSCGAWENALGPKICCCRCAASAGDGFRGCGSMGTRSQTRTRCLALGWESSCMCRGDTHTGALLTEAKTSQPAPPRPPALISPPWTPPSPGGTRPERRSASPTLFKGCAGMKGPSDRTTLIPAAPSSFPSLGNTRYQLPTMKPLKSPLILPPRPSPFQHLLELPGGLAPWEETAWPKRGSWSHQAQLWA